MFVNQHQRQHRVKIASQVDMSEATGCFDAVEDDTADKQIEFS